MSGASNPRARVPAKPLIDIKTLVTDRAGFSSSPEGQSAFREGAPDWGKGKEVEREDITGLARLAALARQAEQEATERSDSPSPTPPSPKVAQPQPKVALSKPTIPMFPLSRHRRTSSDVAANVPLAEDQPPRSVSRGPESSVSVRNLALPEPESAAPVRLVSSARNEVDDEDIMPALRFMMPKTYDDEYSAPVRATVVESPPSPALDEKRIVPTPIRQRESPPPFAVTSRPQHRTRQSGASILTSVSTSASTSTATSPVTVAYSTAATSAASSKAASPRIGPPRSSSLGILTTHSPVDDDSSSSSSSSSYSATLPPSMVKKPIPISTNKLRPSSPVKSTTSSTSKSESSSRSKATITRRPRSLSGSTLISQIPDSPPLNPDNRQQALAPSSKAFTRPDSLVSRIPLPSSSPPAMKPKPFAGGAMRRESPASSTGDSSSGRVPLTPRDGSDLGSWYKMDGLSGGSREGRRDYTKRRTVSFGEDLDLERGRANGPARERERVQKAETPVEGETRRRERRRSEAKAAIEVCLFFVSYEQDIV